jgi:hypothetical protein
VAWAFDALNGRERWHADFDRTTGDLLFQGEQTQPHRPRQHRPRGWFSPVQPTYDRLRGRD